MVRVAINGFGRIGRLALRLMAQDEEFQVVAINTNSDAETLAYLLKYDTAHGNFMTDKITYNGNVLIVNGKEIATSRVKEPENCNWKELDIDLVIDCTGKFNEREKAEAHIKAGAKKVLLSAPAKGDVKTVVYNVNHNILDGTETVISAASCTTNCLAPLAKVLNDEFGIVKGLMTTVHAYTNDQNIHDNSHKSGIKSRRGRAAAANIVPASTGAAKTVGVVLPELKGKLDGIALRVPTITGSVVDLTVELSRNTTVEEINAAVKKAANETLAYTEDPIVSSDVIGSSYACIFDALSTQIMEVDGKQMVKLIAWYDNEMSFTSQLVRVVKYWGSMK
ncbi:Glyceraldehyde-3-phosphate dehydrogenase [bioreactor metagenome]|jgi:glyceraldehyde 3-phosphate dehydrogenase|uniref:Glyceraldehyde-3-phosphate dehydrogenase n=2 Tax=root TaxID=1 RepID=A0A562JHA2_9FIRM|nr:type I glyceraldehyde-3-phosphate dehydrogenase [Sedimentibacter saalensis]MEA5094470.1 type I glyceraldehyde-3-phosphate dehydrogenase [Sedimentibacter saalensis]TWH82617.1 glyceraldehyde 3-phosphate dehydrogenase [Sedimentibacter saalensis]